MTETLGEALVLIKGDLSSLSATLAQAKDTTQKTTAEMNRTLKDVGRGMTDVGKKLTMGLTTPILGAAGAAVKLSTDFSAAMANVATLIPGQAERIEALKAATSDLSAELGKTATEMADGLYQVISAFGDSADTINVLEINAKAAAAGIASVTDAVNLTSAVTKAYGDTSAEAVQNVSDLALLTVRLGQTTFSELAASIGRVTPLTKELGVSQEELFAVMATGTGVTGGAAEVSTQLRGVLQGLLAPTADMSNLLSELGYESGQAMLAEQGLHGAIQTIIRAARDTGVPLQKYISSIEGQTLALALAGPQADTYAQKLAAMEDAAGTTDAAFREQTQGVNATGFAMAQAQQKIAQVTRELGDALAPAITTILDKIDPLVGWVKNLIQHFSELDPKTQTIISAIAGLAVAIGPVLVALGTMTQGLGGLGKMLGSTIGILSKVGGVIAGLATPIAIAVAAGAALYAAYKTNFLGIGDFVRQAIDVIKYHIERIPIYFEGVKGALGALGQVFGGVFEGIGLILQGFDVLVDAYIVAPARKMWEAILSAAQAVGNILKRMMDAIKPIVQPIADFLVKIGVGIGESLKEMFGRATSAITDTLTAAAEQAEDDFSSIEESVSPATQAFGLMAQGALKVADSLDGAGTRIREGWNQSVSEAQEKALQTAQAQRDLVDATEDTAAENEEIEKIFASLNERLDEITAQSEAFGEAFDANAAMAKALESAIVDLLEQGLDPADERIQALKEQLNKVNEAIEGSTKAVEDNEDAWASWVETVQENVQKTFSQSRAEGDSYVGWLEATGQLTQSNLMSWNLSQIRNFEGARDELLDLIAGFYTQWSGNISDLTDEELASIQEIIDAELRGLEARGEGQSEYARTLRLLSNDIILEAQRRDRELSDLQKIQLERSREADTARWNAQVEYYNNLDQKRQEDDERQKELEQAQVERSRAAWGARYQAAADAYLEDQRLAQEQAEFDEAMYRLRVELGEAAADEMIQHDLDRLASIESTSQDAIKVIQGFHKDWSGRIGDLTDIELASLQERLQATIDYYTEKDGADSAYAVTLAALLKQITEEEQKRADEAAEYEAKQLKKRTATWREFTDSVKSALQDVLSGNKTVTEAMTALWNNVVAAAAGRVASQIRSAFDQAYTAVISGAKSAAEVIRAAFSAISFNIVDLALLVIQQIAQAFAAAREAQKKVAEEAQKLREEDLEWQGRYHELTELGFERSYGTITKTLEEEYTYFFGLLKGTASETVEVIDEATKAWIERMEALFGEFASGAVDALEEALSMDDPLDAFDAFTQGIKDQLKEQIISALVEGFLSSQVINQAVAPLLQSIDEAMASAMVGGVFDPASFENSIAPYVAELGMTLDSMGPAFEALFQVADRISGTLTNTGHYVWGDPTEGGTPIYFQPLASGGIATSPTMALIAEKKPEAVIPLDELGRFSGSTTIIVELDGRQIGRAVAPSLTKEIRVRTGMRL